MVAQVDIKRSLHCSKEKKNAGKERKGDAICTAEHNNADQQADAYCVKLAEQRQRLVEWSCQSNWVTVWHCRSKGLWLSRYSRTMTRPAPHAHCPSDAR